MTIWPIILDSGPTCLRGHSLLLTPLGADTLIGQLQSWLGPLTTKPLTVVARPGIDQASLDAMRSACAGATVVSGQQEFADAIASCELSDALLIIDPRCIPADENEYAALVRQSVEAPRVAHQLVAFETDIAGTKEHVSVDGNGQVRGVLRYYEQTTWPFIAGVAATMLPVACGIVNDEAVPSSLAELRQRLASRGVPSQDLPITVGALDLSSEPGLLAANEQLVLRSAPAQWPDSDSAQVLVGDGHVIHSTARIVGAVVMHAGVRVDEHATLIGPAVIGAGAVIHAGAVVAHAIVGAGCAVPQGVIARDRVWLGAAAGDSSVETSLRQPLSYRDRLARLTVEHREPYEKAFRQRHQRAKRAFDIAVAAASLTILSPVLLIVAILTWLESGRPIFYAQRREGRGGHVFRCWKFRTMSVNADQKWKDLKAVADTMDGPHFKLKHDPRVTKVGRVLRALNVDELPQFVNVLMGDMSLVGPRPSPFRENQVCVPWREARLSVRPGITGLWQVCRHDRSAGDFHQWIEYDVMYVQHGSFWLDLKILLATVLTLGGKKHVRSSWLVRLRSNTLKPGAPSFNAVRPASTRRVATT